MPPTPATAHARPSPSPAPSDANARASPVNHLSAATTKDAPHAATSEKDRRGRKDQASPPLAAHENPALTLLALKAARAASTAIAAQALEHASPTPHAKVEQAGHVSETSPPSLATATTAEALMIANHAPTATVPDQANEAPMARPIANSMPRANLVPTPPIAPPAPKAPAATPASRAAAPTARRNPSLNPANLSQENPPAPSRRNPAASLAKKPSPNPQQPNPASPPAPSTSSKATRSPSANAHQRASSNLRKANKPDGGAARKHPSPHAA